ncbi:serine-threonine protein kinase, partial [Streptomyces sp. NPDC049577]|uniref:serine-threonine protein kinase n=1 Tax=Streptomyces sp. NPDC049577 TaxID=3155153 RepID=UPI003449F9B1
MASTRVEPYWELTFDAEGDADPRERDALIRGAAQTGVTDLMIFAHGWNSSPSTATRLYRSFFALFGGLPVTGSARLGHAGVIWPSMRFTDEPIPDFPDRPAAAAGPGLAPGTREALEAVFPDRREVIGRLSELAEGRPEDPARLTEFAELARTLAGRPGSGPASGAAGTATGPAPDPAADTGADTGVPAMLTEDPRQVCERFADALAGTGAAPATLLGGALRRLWDGALELLRQITYFEMKRRAGTVGEAGLGPALGALAGACPGLRVHLIGHSFGARLMAFALRGLPAHTNPVRSLTMLQGAFSHYAFASRLPFDARHAGALGGLAARVNGPVVGCHSRHDLALAVMYPLASRLSGDDHALLGLDEAR